MKAALDLAVVGFLLGLGFTIGAALVVQTMWLIGEITEWILPTKKKEGDE